MNYINQVIQGDCLNVLRKIKSGIVDLILCDLPYGITQNKWDKVIDLAALWKEYKRVLTPRGVVALTGQGAFTAKLILSNLSWFKYKIVWIKSKSTNFLNANKQPLRRHEDVCIFYNRQPTYNPQKISGLPYDKGIRKDNQSGNYGAYNSSRAINADGKRFPSDVLCYEPDIIDWVYCKTAESEGTYHPTQKPVALGRWIIRTFTNIGDLVLDNACGSGSFLVSAIKEKRRFIGIEKNEQSYHMHGNKVDYIKTCKRRILEAQNKSTDLFDPI